MTNERRKITHADLTSRGGYDPIRHHAALRPLETTEMASLDVIRRSPWITHPDTQHVLVATFDSDYLPIRGTLTRIQPRHEFTVEWSYDGLAMTTFVTSEFSFGTTIWGYVMLRDLENGTENAELARLKRAIELGKQYQAQNVRTAIRSFLRFVAEVSEKIRSRASGKFRAGS